MAQHRPQRGKSVWRQLKGMGTFQRRMMKRSPRPGFGFGLGMVSNLNHYSCDARGVRYLCDALSMLVAWGTDSIAAVNWNHKGPGAQELEYLLIAMTAQGKTPSNLHLYLYRVGQNICACTRALAYFPLRTPIQRQCPAMP